MADFRRTPLLQQEVDSKRSTWPSAPPRYGCRDQDNSRWSRRAFQFLHRHYPNSRWAKATKYYY